MILKPDFFEQETLQVARSLLGKYCVRAYGGKHIAYKITEVEAYDGPSDRASHAHRGRTDRNDVMFGPAGVWYVYLVYGMHWMLNIVTGPINYPAAVLFRGVLENGEPIIGPARLTKRLHIDRRLNGKAATISSGLWIEDRGERVPHYRVRRTPRIGVGYAGAWAKKPYRFCMMEGKTR